MAVGRPEVPPRTIGPADPAAPSLVLASRSRARRRMLCAAGVPCSVDAADVDEGEIKASLRADGGGPEDCAEVLAELKATRVSPRHPGSLVLGADQMLACEDTWFDKPRDRTEAAAQLRALSGRTHQLIACAVIVHDGTRIWHQLDRAALTVRELSDGFVDAYLDSLGEDALQSVGAYQLEGLGAQLFSRVQGDYFTVLGLPLLPLLEFLRNREVVPR